MKSSASSTLRSLGDSERIQRLRSLRVGHGTSSFKKKRCRKDKVIPCTVVDDHNEALELLHGAIRAKCLPWEFAMCHVDAHPDLNWPPAANAAMILEDPQQLYCELCNSSGGIAEFLLPLVYAGHTRRIAWLKPPWADQIAEGGHFFKVGEEKASGALRVTSPAPYFADEGLFAQEDSLNGDTAKPLQLDVATPCNASADRLKGIQAALSELAGSSWVLDICLDYFATKNPFLDCCSLSPRLVDLLRRVYLGPSWRKNLERRRIESHCRKRSASERSRGCAACDATFQRCHAIAEKRFHALMAQLCRVVSAHRQDGNDILVHVAETTIRSLASMYDDPASARSLISSLTSTLAQEVSSEKMMHAIASETGPMADLPLHMSSRDEVRSMVDQLGGILSKLPTRPSFITIARSAPEYTPRADDIQNAVFEMLRKVYGDEVVSVV